MSDHFKCRFAVYFSFFVVAVFLSHNMAINMHTTVNMHKTQYIPFYGYYRQRKFIIFVTGNNCSMLTQNLHVADRHQCYDTVCVTAIDPIVTNSLDWYTLRYESHSYNQIQKTFISPLQHAWRYTSEMHFSPATRMHCTSSC